ncbi:M15 family metallopeptidase [Limnoraphis robusta Tam1]|uniref:D-alanyl-D-alanine dipeptidase n=1 Tax=Limnoraphis robusta CCNP1315 TaxID=3110306 RepID=A0ABU5TWN6_9CYAN|nr:M15 family metallopeptidase [Limnoraphis robusta]MEA5518383.1 M15 family metallopeptidase [Limnoraphis robusta CCNP1315]MEA5542926.1 M15 family metallopeptidase [Limnoraphis robusta Tam1]MEA5547764.1 M15 family metallopeptidase [Limnoraphis robusta CCNP1324]
MTRKLILFITVLLSIVGCHLTAIPSAELQGNSNQAIAVEMAQNPPESPPIQVYSPVQEREKLVDIRDINPNIKLDIRYATTQNFLKRKLYSVPRCLLRADVAQSLSKVQQDIEGMGLGLKVFDCYRPWSVTKQMWEILPDNRYVANPQRGSRHNRGAAVDLTLVDLRNGKELEMPTDFDDFTDKAARDYPHNSPQVRRNSDLLEYKMKQYGFSSLITEWWHFDAVGWNQYSLLDVQLDRVP